MRKFPYKTWLWAGIFLLYPWVAYGAGLGKLTVLSTLGQPLSAEIDLMSVQKDELTTLSARIASPDAFQQANMQYSPALIGVRMTIERRSDGKPYIKIISTRSVNDPFLAILIELTWAQGRLLREYTALIDPPGYNPTPAPVTPPVAATTPVAPPVAPETQPIAPPPPPEAGAPAVAPPKPAAKTAPGKVAAPTKVEGNEYAVKRGDTLARIAAGVKPEGVTLDQMLVSLYRNNTDAFAGNMNRLKTGTILRVPEKERIAETAPAEATKEVRVQASNWNAYRLKLAEAAGAAPAQETTKAASGKITTAVEDKAAGKEAPKEVLKLSKGDAGAGKAASGKPVSAKERMHMLEEEAVAREKSLTEANERVAQLEENIKKMQRLLEIKGVVPPGAKPPVAPAPPAKADQVAKAEPAKAPPAKAEPPKAEPAKVEPAKAEPAKDAGKAPVEPAKADQKGGDQKGAPPVVEPPKAEAPKAEAPKAEAPKAEAPKAEAPKAAPQPKPKAAAPPPPVAEPGLVDQIMTAVSDPIYLAGGLGGLAVLGVGAYMVARRRRAQAANDDVKGAKTAPTLAAAAAPGASMAASPLMSPVAGDDVDPLAEADLYLNFGRDAQAEEVLKEALQKNPQHSEAQLKLLQIYAARKDKAEFEKVARSLNTQTSGVGDTWIKAAGMGYAFDSENSLYEAGKSAPAATVAPVAGGAIAGTDLDFDLELSPGAAAATTDVPLDSGEKTMVMTPGELAAMSDVPADATETQDVTQDSVAAQAFAPDPAASPDFTLNAPAAGAATNVPDFTVDAPADVKTDVTGDSAAGPMVSAIDFNFDSPAKKPAAESVEFKHDSTMVLTPENQDKAAGLDMDFDVGGAAAPAAPIAATGTGSLVQIDPDFKLDLGVDAGTAAPAGPDIKLDDISLDLGGAPKADAAAPAAGGAKDDHWYDVQTKFDLAKAYQEMGDKDGAREILQEVIKEGDTAQQAEAKQLLQSLG